ncbi:hypothetical protein [Curtobacterium sp. MCLR17_034]|uniref:hypothetical protein n=1 Tax=Curtobacterium sp. MCLR17_034 TaxID=2175623 RepID=UPI0015E8D2D0|nr:hypothetical protein [Curtobacterium sp. MCLR17_034]
MTRDDFPNYDVLFNVAEQHYDRFAETWVGDLTDESRQAFLAGWFNGRASQKDGTA